MYDTGSGVTSANCDQLLPEHQLRESKDGKRGVKYVSASGGIMENKGEAEIQLESTRGKQLHITFPNSDVIHPTISGRKLLRKGCEVYLKQTGGWIKLPNGDKIDIVVHAGVLWVELRVVDKRAPGFTGPGM